MSKVLVCITAQARAGDLTWASFRANVLEPLGADLALCISESDSNNDLNPFWKEAQYKWTCREYNDYGDAFDEVQKEILGASILPEWRKLLSIPYQWLGGIKGDAAHPGPSAILIVYRWYLLRNILECGLLDVYEWFIITRSDFIWSYIHPPISYFDKNQIGIPYGENYGGYTDRHAVVHKTMLIRYLNIIHDIIVNSDKLHQGMKFDDRWNLEKYIFYELNKSPKALVRYFPYVMYTVRNSKTKTTWSQGIYNKDLGYYIKYPSEYRKAQRSIKILKRLGSWESQYSKFFLRNWIIIILFLRERNTGDVIFRLLYIARHNALLLGAIRFTKRCLKTVYNTLFGS